MVAQIQNTYYVGKNQPYSTINQAINTIWAALESQNYSLPPLTSPDGGNVNIVIKGSGKFPGFKIPDNMTAPLRAANRYLVIKRQEYTEDGKLISNNSLPIITPSAAGAQVQEEDKLIGIDIGSNNSNVKIVGLRVSEFVIGVTASFNSNNLYIDRCFLTNNINAQVYTHNTEGIYLTNNIIVGGEYGVVIKFTKNIRFYHNTVFLDGLTAIDNKTKAGIILQGERTFANNSPSTVYCLGNLVYTIGCPACIFYEEDLKTSRLVSDYNNFYSQTAVVQLRQDNATLPGDVSEIIKANYSNINQWKAAGLLGTNPALFIDVNSVSLHPIFIQNVSLLSSVQTSIINLGSIDNSPLLNKVPSWYFANDNFYIPSDFNSETISVDCLLNTREQPNTAIGANDKRSLNGFYGQDIFTSPLDLDPEKKCDLDPLNIVSVQELSMQYPAIRAGHFWSHERPYYLYGKKGAYYLGDMAVTTFQLPGYIDPKKTTTIEVGGKLLPEEYWNLIGKSLVIHHNTDYITSYEDEIHIDCNVKFWYDNGYATEKAYYVFKIKDGTTEYYLPETYQAGSPTVITDDRVSYTSPSDIARREFRVEYDSTVNRSKIVFGANHNLWDNGDFTHTLSGKTPAGWVAPSQPTTGVQNVFMLGNQYSYWGDYAVGLRLNSEPGYLISPSIRVSDDDSLSLSWHARLPIDITGLSGETVTGLPAHYAVKFFDNYNERMNYELNGTFNVSSSSYQRYSLSFGPDDQLFNTSNTGVVSAPLTQLSTPIGLPSNVTRLEMVISGSTWTGQISSGAFMMLDCMQAEYDVNPTYYHPKASLTNMTVECETDPSGVFIDKRMNISSVFNDNPNAFLYISDMPATIWGGPSDPEVTTLHEYRWPHGRLSVLPWARIFGKDKLSQKSLFADQPNQPLDIIAPYVLPRRAAEASITPGVVRSLQGADAADGFNIQVLDSLGNPYGLRNYVLHVYDQRDQFPGWLSKKYFGAKEQLGTTIYGSLNSNGSLNAFYTAPDAYYIRYVGPIPKPTSAITGFNSAIDSISNVQTSYSVSQENNGNITIIGLSGKFMPTVSDTSLSGQYSTIVNAGRNYIALEYPPVFGSVSVKTEEDTFLESYVQPQTNEFFVDYTFGTIELPVSNNVSYSVQYVPKYAYPSPSVKNNIIIHNNKVFGQYQGPIQIDYDAELNIELRVADIMNREFVATFPVIVQNPNLSKIENTSLSFEF